jgi:hypothetical protein
VVDLQKPARGMMLQPFPHVPLRRAGTPGELTGRRRTALMQRPIQAQAFAEIDREQLERPQRVTEQPVGERFGRILHRRRMPRGHRHVTDEALIGLRA